MNSDYDGPHLIVSDRAEAMKWLWLLKKTRSERENKWLLAQAAEESVLVTKRVGFGDFSGDIYWTTLSWFWLEAPLFSDFYSPLCCFACF